MANAVAKTKKSDVVEFDGAMFEQDAGQGNQNISSDDLALPFQAFKWERRRSELP